MLLFIRNSELVILTKKGSSQRIPFSADAFRYQEIINKELFIKSLHETLPYLEKGVYIIIGRTLSYIVNEDRVPIEKNLQLTVQNKKNSLRITVNKRVVETLHEWYSSQSVHLYGIYSECILPENSSDYGKITGVLKKNQWSNFIDSQKSKQNNNSSFTVQRTVLLLVLLFLCIALLFAVYTVPRTGIFTSKEKLSPAPTVALVPTRQPENITPTKRSELKILISNASEIPGKAGLIKEALINDNFPDGETETATESAKGTIIQFSKKVAKNDKEAIIKIVANEGFQPKSTAFSNNTEYSVVIILGK